jgi:pimeloyl-ACP methyl ester carboxylesterase
VATLLAVLFAWLALEVDAQAQTQCPAGMHCGSVTVPLDRTHPSAGTIDVAYAIVPRTDTTRPSLGTIVPNPGGPGIATIASAGLYVDALAPLRTRRELLLIDARGTGRSGALTCPSLASENPLLLDQTTVGRLCGADLGARAGLYGSAAVADDIDAVRAALGLDKLDLFGDSYGTFLMPVYAARHPEHVRSIVLDGAFPIAADPWGRDVLKGTRRVITLVCRRTQRCSGKRVLGWIAALSVRLRRHPITFRARTPIGRVKLTLGEGELANVTYGGGHPEVYGFLPAAVASANKGDFALLKRLVTVDRIGQVGTFFIDPSNLSTGASIAASCHDYPRPYNLAAAPADRRAEYAHALKALDPGAFAPFSAGAWLGTDIDAGPKCLDWPADSTAGSPLEGHKIPDVPVLVQSGELDSDTPVEQGRAAAAQFAHPTIGVVANAGHTPDLQPCGVAMAIDFIEHLRTDPGRCRHAGQPPRVVGMPALHVGQIPTTVLHGPRQVRLAIGVALATIADAQSLAAYSGMTGRLDALRGGTYVFGPRGVRFLNARVVTDAVANGTQTTQRHVIRTTLRLRGRGVPASHLTIRTAGKTTRVTGTVGGYRVTGLLVGSSVR